MCTCPLSLDKRSRYQFVDARWDGPKWAYLVSRELSIGLQGDTYNTCVAIFMNATVPYKQMAMASGVRHGHYDPAMQKRQRWFIALGDSRRELGRTNIVDWPHSSVESSSRQTALVI